MYWENYAFSNCLDTVLTYLIEWKVSNKYSGDNITRPKGARRPDCSRDGLELPDRTHLYGGVGVLPAAAPGRQRVRVEEWPPYFVP